MQLLASARSGESVTSAAARLFWPKLPAGERPAARQAEVKRARLLDRLWQNDFRPSVRAACRDTPRLAELLRHLSLGVLAEPGARRPTDLFHVLPGSPTFRTTLFRTKPTDVPRQEPGTLGSRLDASDSLCARIHSGQPVAPEELRHLLRWCGAEEPWSHTLITAMLLSDAFLARGLVQEAALALEKALDAERGLRRLALRHAPASLPAELAAYRMCCLRVLASFEPPIPATKQPLRTLRAICRAQTERRRPAPRETIDALDAVITAGQSAPAQELQSRVVEQLARMLGGRVLFHYSRGAYRQREAQSIHTLSSWSLRRLLRTTEVRAHRVAARPEFWRPEQRRPRGVLVFPVGAGVAAIARSNPLKPRDVDAARTILRFLAAQQGARPASTENTSTAEAPATPRQPPVRGLIGSSPAWGRVLESIWRLGPTPCSVVLHGETGTGKELVARALHRTSARTGHPFVAVNCAAIHPETMLAELFGHIRGAYTGALKPREGLVRSAHRGTLFLDEVGDMPAAMQVALLRTLQERSVRPVGGTRDLPADVRVIAATHQDLGRAVAEGRFREDLYHRLNVMEIELPPLRERLEDIPALAAHFLHQEEGPRRTLPNTALAALARYGWPGNVRELANVIQASALLSQGPAVEAAVIKEVLETRRRAIRHQPSPTRVDPRTRRLLKLTHERWQSAGTLARALGVSTRTVNRDLARLLESGLVEHHGEARARRYRACRDSS